MKTKKVIGSLILGFGVLFFFGFLYILPVGTDWYLYVWVQVVFHGNWLYGDIAANGVALAGIVVGYVMMREEGEAPFQNIKRRRTK